MSFKLLYAIVFLSNTPYSLKMNKIKQIVKSSWQKHYDNGALNYKYPNEILVKFVNPVLNEINTILDLGGGPQNNTRWIKQNKKVISIDYCNIPIKKIKNIKKYKLDIAKKNNLLRKIFINNSELIIMNQILDHIFYNDSIKVAKKINQYYDKTKYVFVSFLLNSCKGDLIKGKTVSKNSYISTIAKKYKSLIELHTFYSSKQVKYMLKLLNNFIVKKKNVITDEYYIGNKNQKMVTTYLLLKRKNIN